MKFQIISYLLIIGLISGVILITIINKNKYRAKEEEKVVFEEKPKFSVRRAKDKEKPDIQVLIASFKCINETQFLYDKKLEKDEDMVFDDYIFENTGKSVAKKFGIIMNENKYFSILEYSKRKSFFENKINNYYIEEDKAEIEEGKTIKVRVYKHKDEKFPSYLSAGLSIFFTDENGKYWEQPFSYREIKLYGPFKGIRIECSGLNLDVF